MNNVVFSHAAGPDSIPGWVNFLVEVFSGFPSTENLDHNNPGHHMVIIITKSDLHNQWKWYRLRAQDTDNNVNIYYIITVFCLRAGVSLQTQEPRLQFRPQQT